MLKIKSSIYYFKLLGFILSFSVSLVINLTVFLAVSENFIERCIFIAIALALETTKGFSLITGNSLSSLSRKIRETQPEVPISATKVSAIKSYICYGVFAALAVFTSLCFSLYMRDKTVSSFENQLSIKNTEIIGLTSQKTDKQDLLNSLQSDLTRNEAELDKLEEQIDSIENQITNREGYRRTYNSTVTRIDSQLPDAQEGSQEYKSLTGQRAETLSNITSNNREINRLTAEKNSLKEERETILSARSNLRAQIESLRGEIFELQSKETGLSIERTTIEGQRNASQGSSRMFFLLSELINVPENSLRFVFLLGVALLVELAIIITSPRERITRSLLYDMIGSLSLKLDIDKLVLDLENDVIRFTDREITLTKIEADREGHIKEEGSIKEKEIENYGAFSSTSKDIIPFQPSPVQQPIVPQQVVLQQNHYHNTDKMESIVPVEKDNFFNLKDNFENPIEEVKYNNKSNIKSSEEKTRMSDIIEEEVVENNNDNNGGEVKKRRGRPPKDPNKVVEKKEEVVTSEPKRRGRPPKNPEEKIDTNTDLHQLQQAEKLAQVSAQVSMPPAPQVEEEINKTVTTSVNENTVKEMEEKISTPIVETPKPLVVETTPPPPPSQPNTTEEENKLPIIDKTLIHTYRFGKTTEEVAQKMKTLINLIFNKISNANGSSVVSFDEISSSTSLGTNALKTLFHRLTDMNMHGIHILEKTENEGIFKVNFNQEMVENYVLEILR
jgi:hypothetical protein